MKHEGDMEVIYRNCPILSSRFQKLLKMETLLCKFSVTVDRK